MSEQMKTQDTSKSRSIDPITLEIIRHRLLSIPNQIDANITRTAFSPLIYEYKDYAVGMVDPSGKLIAQGQGGIPIFVANALGIAVQDGLEIYGPDGFAEGDVIITNYAGSQGQHLNNVVMYTPVFVGPEHELACFMAVTVHWIDIGGRIVGSCVSNESTDIFQEGIQFRTVKLWSNGQRVDEIYRMIEYNTRFPTAVLGDLEAQLAGCLMGRDLASAVFETYGLPVVREAIHVMWDKSEKAARDAIRQIPDGEYSASSFLDNDGIDLERNIPIDVLVRVHGDEMTVDFSGVADQLVGPLNSGLGGGAITAARVAFKYLATPDEPANEGSFRPLHVVIPDGKFLSASATAAMGSYSAPLPTVIDTVLKAMAPAAPDRVAGGHHGTFTVHIFYGRDPSTGELFQNLESGHGGWGAMQGLDGSGPFKTMAHGDTQDVPVEVEEALYPLRIDCVAFRTDSAGAGEFRGGLGVERVYSILAPCELTVTAERNGCPPWGLLGGMEAEPAEIRIERAADGAKDLLLKGTTTLQTNDRVRVLTGGGGGFGQPTKRDPSRVASDVARGYVSSDAARVAYGVVCTQDGRIDASATEELRTSGSALKRTVSAK